MWAPVAASECLTAVSLSRRLIHPSSTRQPHPSTPSIHPPSHSSPSRQTDRQMDRQTEGRTDSCLQFRRRSAARQNRSSRGRTMQHLRAQRRVLRGSISGADLGGVTRVTSHPPPRRGSLFHLSHCLHLLCAYNIFYKA